LGIGHFHETGDIYRPAASGSPMTLAESQLAARKSTAKINEKSSIFSYISPYAIELAYIVKEVLRCEDTNYMAISL
jgi:hypothetical protein